MKAFSIFAILAALGMPLGVYAGPGDDEYIRETARKTGDSVEVVRSYQKKCESGVTREMAECTEYFSKVADKELNNVYQVLRRKHEKGSMAEKRLIEAQRTWIAFRDATCQYESEGVRGGTLEGVYVMNCLSTQTAKRVKELKVYLNCTSNDCP